MSSLLTEAFEPRLRGSNDLESSPISLPCDDYKLQRLTLSARTS